MGVIGISIFDEVLITALVIGIVWISQAKPDFTATGKSTATTIDGQYVGWR